MSTNIGRKARKVTCQYCGARHVPGEHSPCPLIAGTVLDASPGAGVTHTPDVRCPICHASAVALDLQAPCDCPPDAVTTPDTIAGSVAGLAVTASAIMRRGRARVCGDCWYVLRPDQYEPYYYPEDFEPCSMCSAEGGAMHRVSWAEIDAADREGWAKA